VSVTPGVAAVVDAATVSPPVLEISAVWFVSDFWEDQLVEHGRQYLGLVSGRGLPER
jgi:hypothetical protein